MREEVKTKAVLELEAVLGGAAEGTGGRMGLQSSRFSLGGGGDFRTPLGEGLSALVPSQADGVEAEGCLRASKEAEDVAGLLLDIRIDGEERACRDGKRQGDGGGLPEDEDEDGRTNDATRSNKHQTQ